MAVRGERVSFLQRCVLWQVNHAPGVAHLGSKNWTQWVLKKEKKYHVGRELEGRRSQEQGGECDQDTLQPCMRFSKNSQKYTKKEKIPTIQISSTRWTISIVVIGSNVCFCVECGVGEGVSERHVTFHHLLLKATGEIHITPFQKRLRKCLCRSFGWFKIDLQRSPLLYPELQIKQSPLIVRQGALRTEGCVGLLFSGIPCCFLLLPLQSLPEVPPSLHFNFSYSKAFPVQMLTCLSAADWLANVVVSMHTHAPLCIHIYKTEKMS